MSTDNKHTHVSPEVRGSIGREIMSVLNACTINMSSEQTLRELQLTVERLTFASENIGEDMSMTDVDTILGGDVSPGTMSFIAWLHKRNAIRLLFGENGRMLLSFCVRYYRNVQQVRCSTPIPLRESFRIKLLTQLRILYPEPINIIFETVPSLVAGCIIDDGHKRVDMSLQSKIPKLVSQYVDATRPVRTAPHES
ncbi:MAG: F0F1 ATP synthase subunit delta [Candidatus Nomurabacteria bacterium]|nr:MAG: F0F1 ATP synthase subunit delta [Candidatus Nomurabacteria bacterium]